MFFHVSFSPFENHLLENSDLEMPSLNPYKPNGTLDSFKMRALDSGLGISVDGVASKISVYGLDKMEIQHIE